MLILIKLQVICTNILVVLIQNTVHVFHTGHTEDNDLIRKNTTCFMFVELSIRKKNQMSFY